MVKNALFLVFLGFILYHVKYSFINFEEEIASVQCEIDNKEKEYSVLLTEWKYLTSPDRIQYLSDKYLALFQTSPFQVRTMQSYKDTGGAVFVSKKRRKN